MVNTSSEPQTFSTLLGLEVVDSLGQHWGDRVLLAVSDRLRGHLPPTAVLGRPESDEFMVMMTDLRSPADAVALAESLLEALRPAL